MNDCVSRCSSVYLAITSDEEKAVLCLRFKHERNALASVEHSRRR